MENIILFPIPLDQLKEVIDTSIKVALDSHSANQDNFDDPNKRLTIKEVCDKYNISKPTIHKHMRLGLEFEKIGRKTLFRSADVEAYFRSKTKN